MLSGARTRGAAHGDGTGGMEREKRRRARLRLVTRLGQSESWREAAARAGLRTSRTAACRLLRVVLTQGEDALDERRQSHPAKFREPVTAWLLTCCHAYPGTPSRAVRAALQERFGLVVSISQLNRVRAVLGISNRPQDAGGGYAPSSRRGVGR